MSRWAASAQTAARWVVAEPGPAEERRTCGRWRRVTAWRQPIPDYLLLAEAAGEATGSPETWAALPGVRRLRARRPLAVGARAEARRAEQPGRPTHSVRRLQQADSVSVDPAVARPVMAAGGGGGGYYGGGGGGGADALVGAGGGAGSSFVEPTASDSSIGIASQQNGEVTLTYQVGPPTAHVVTPGPGGTYTQNQFVRTSFSCAEANGGPGISSCADSTGHSGPADISPGTLDTATLGTHRYSVTARSSDGQSGISSIIYTVVRRPRPVLANLSITPRSFRASRRGGTIIHSPREGARIRYRDSQAAQATFTIYRHKGTHRCSAHPHTGCPRLAFIGTFKHADKAGANGLRFSGRINGRALAPGDYQLDLSAELRGQAGNTATESFRILAR